MYQYVELGREVIASGQLKQLREELGWSMSAMAEALHASPQTYASWEFRPKIRVWPVSAERVGRFYTVAREVLSELRADGISIANMVPFHLAASQLGVPQEVLLERHRTGELPAEDLGILGLWIHKDDL